MLLTSLLGALSGVAVYAQTNVYSLNAVGYINVQIPPGWSILTCPLISSPDNTLGTLLPNTNEEFGRPGFHTQVFAMVNGSYVSPESAVAPSVSPDGSGWSLGGTAISINPGSGVFIYNPFTSNLPVTWVGTVPSGSLTNALTPGFNLVGSILPTYGDLVTNSLTTLTNPTSHDVIYTYDAIAQSFSYYEYFPAFHGWGFDGSTSNLQDPTTTNIVQGFFYYNASTTTTNNWVENYSI